MSFLNALVIPIQLEALVVNASVRGAQPFNRLTPKYNNMTNCGDPFAFKTIDGNNGDVEDGVYLRWELPKALKDAVETKGGEFTYPILPNRWLVARYTPKAKQAIKCWMLYSDEINTDIDSDEPGAPQWQSQGGRHQPVNVGKKVELQSEEFDLLFSGENSMDLTAVQSCNTEFLRFQPFNQNNFSIFDRISTKEANLLESANYMVFGWYHSRHKDILPGAEAKEVLSQFLKEQNWQIGDTPEESLSGSGYYGLLKSVDLLHQFDAKAHFKSINIAVGDTTADALTAFIKQQDGIRDETAELFRAFQHEYLDVLDEPNGMELLEQAISKSRFSAFHGGIRWHLQDDVSLKDVKSPVEAGENEARFIAELNTTQELYDRKVNELLSRQWQYYAAWFKGVRRKSLEQFMLPIPIKEPEFHELKQQFDTSSPETLASKINILQKEIVELRNQLPLNQLGEVCETRVESFRKGANIAASRLLCWVAKSPYRLPKEPVVLISGIEHNTSNSNLDDEQHRHCRVLNDEFLVARTADLKAIAKKLNKENPISTPTIKELIAEMMVFFEAAQDISLATQFVNGDKLDAFFHQACQTWYQPWRPNFLKWEIEYIPVPTSQKDNWFFDGKTQHLNTAVSENCGLTSNLKVYRGITPLSFHHNELVKQQLSRFLGDQFTDKKRLNELTAKVQNWNFVTLSLDGLNDNLTTRERGMIFPYSHVAGVFRDDIEDALKHDENTFARMTGDDIETLPMKEKEQSDFFGIRGGIFRFKKVDILDSFGQSKSLVRDGMVKYPVKDSPYQTGVRPQLQNAFQWMQLTPRIMTPARLHFDIAPPTKSHFHKGPIEGWLMVNHLDKSVDVYAPDGEALGKLYQVFSHEPEGTVIWDPGPEVSPINLDEMKTELPTLHKVVSSFLKTSSDEFTDLIKVIDSTLWTIDPLGEREEQNLSLLLGRPLAVINVSIAFEYKGLPRVSADKQDTFFDADKNLPAYLEESVEVCFGRQKNRQDGLIGYYNDNSFRHFRSVYPLSNHSDFIEPIKPGGFFELSLNQSAHLTMIVDPRAAVFAQTPLLPPKRLQLSPDMVERAQQNMKPIFRTGPVLSAILASEEPEFKKAISTATPRLKQGKWSWLRPGESIEEWEVNKSGLQPYYEELSTNQLEEGFLKLSGALGHKTISDD